MECRIPLRVINLPQATAHHIMSIWLDSQRELLMMGEKDD